MAQIVEDGVEIGFGSKRFKNKNEELVGDAGFGAPEFISVNSNDYYLNDEAGFGDPFLNIDMEILTENGSLFLPDDGGINLRFKGQFKNLFSTFGITNVKDDQIIGPFKVKFVNDEDTSISYFALSGLSGLGTNLFLQSDQKNLFCFTPVMKQGTYSIKLIKGPFITNILQKLQITNRLRNDKKFSIRNNLPKFMNRGEISDNYPFHQQYDIGSETNIAVLTSIVAENLEQIYSSKYTVLTNPLKFGDSRIVVESTALFPENGILVLDSDEEITYTSKTEFAFEGISGVTKLSPKKTRVQLKNETFSKIENYYKFKDNDFYKPKTIRNDNFEEAFNKIEINERSSQKVISEYLYSLLKQLNLIKSCTIINGEITIPDFDINSTHYNKMCKINDKFYFIENIKDDNTSLFLDKIGCAYWNAFNLEDNEYVIEILPWKIIKDFSGEFIIELEKSCFLNTEGFIDKDFIDFNIFINGYDFDENTQKNLNLDLFVAASIKEQLVFSDSSEIFGTFFTSNANSEFIQIIPDYTLNEE